MRESMARRSFSFFSFSFTSFSFFFFSMKAATAAAAGGSLLWRSPDSQSARQTKDTNQFLGAEIILLLLLLYALEPGGNVLWSSSSGSGSSIKDLLHPLAVMTKKLLSPVGLFILCIGLPAATRGEKEKRRRRTSGARVGRGGGGGMTIVCVCAWVYVRLWVSSGWRRGGRPVCLCVYAYELYVIIVDHTVL